MLTYGYLPCTCSIHTHAVMVQLYKLTNPGVVLLHRLKHPPLVGNDKHSNKDNIQEHWNAESSYLLML